MGPIERGIFFCFCYPISWVNGGAFVALPHPRGGGRQLFLPCRCSGSPAKRAADSHRKYVYRIFMSFGSLSILYYCIKSCLYLNRQVNQLPGWFEKEPGQQYTGWARQKLIWFFDDNGMHNVLHTHTRTHTPHTHTHTHPHTHTHTESLRKCSSWRHLWRGICSSIGVVGAACLLSSPAGWRWPSTKCALSALGWK